MTAQRAVVLAVLGALAGIVTWLDSSAPAPAQQAGGAVVAECESDDIGPRWRRDAAHVGRFGVFFHGLGWADRVPHGNHVLKAPAVLVGDEPVSLRVPDRAIGDVGLFYDDAHRLNSTYRISKVPTEVTFEPCAGAPRSVWAGGLLFDRVRKPLRLEVVIGDSRTRTLTLEPGRRGAPRTNRGGEPPVGAPTEVAVTADDPRLPPRCRPQGLGEDIIRFNAGLNTGDVDVLRKFWKERRRGLESDTGLHAKGSFKWFSIGRRSDSRPNTEFVAFRPERAFRYVRRHPLRMQLTQLSVERENRHDGGLIYRGFWTRADGGTGEVIGKAAIDCRTSLIRVWSMAVYLDGGAATRDPCPDPEGGASPGTLVVCARRGDGG